MQGLTAKYRNAWVLMAAAKLLKDEEEALMGLRLPSNLKIEKREAGFAIVTHSCQAPASPATFVSVISSWS